MKRINGKAASIAINAKREKEKNTEEYYQFAFRDRFGGEMETNHNVFHSTPRDFCCCLSFILEMSRTNVFFVASFHLAPLILFTTLALCVGTVSLLFLATNHLFLWIVCYTFWITYMSCKKTNYKTATTIC